MSTSQRDIPVANIMIDASGLPGALPEAPYFGLRLLGAGAPQATDNGPFMCLTFPSIGIVPVSKNLADLSALDDTIYANGDTSFVGTLLQGFMLDKTSTAVIDGITVVATRSGVGRWMRVLSPVPLWAAQINWFVDPVGGNDQNLGVTNVAGQRLQTVAEACRRLHQAKTGKNYQITVVNQAGGVSTVLNTDTFRPSFLEETNPSDVLSTGLDQIVNITLNGSRFTVASSSMTGAGYTPVAGNTPATMVDGAFPGGIAAHIGDMVVVTNDPVTPANNGAVAFIAKDQGAGVARVSDFLRTTNAPATAMAAGTTYDIVQLTAWNPSFIQMGCSQGRFTIQNLDFVPAPGAPPVDQNLVSYRNASVTFRTCRFRRSFQPSVGSGSSIVACAFVYAAGAGTGIGGATVVEQTTGVLAIGLGTLLLNTDLRLVFGCLGFFFGVTCQGSVVQTRGVAAAGDYGANLPAAATRGTNFQISAPNGLAIWDAPAGAGTFGLLLCDDASWRIGTGANLRGNGAETGVIVRGSAKLMVEDGITPAITGATHDAMIDGAAFACWTPSPLSGAGAIAITDAAFSVWADWTNAASFNRHAFNPATGSIITTVPG